MKLYPWLSSSASQRRSLCSGLPAVYQDLSTRHDRPVKKSHWSIGQSGWKEIRNALPAIRWIRWGPRTRILALVRRCYLPRLNYVCDAGYHTVYARRKTMVCSIIVNRENLGWTVFGVLYQFCIYTTKGKISSTANACRGLCSQDW